MAYTAIERLGTRQFASKSNETLEANCYLVNFHRLLKFSDDYSIDPLIKNRDLLHAIVALYNSCLPNIEPDALYSTICGKHSWTIVVLLSAETALEQLCTINKCEPDLDVDSRNYSKHQNEENKNDLTDDSENDKTENSSSLPNCLDSNDVTELHNGDSYVTNATDSTNSAADSSSLIEGPSLESFLQVVQRTFSESEEERAKSVCPSCRPSKFSGVFSDEEDEGEESEEESEDSDNEDAEEYMRGADMFLAEVKFQ